MLCIARSGLRAWFGLSLTGKELCMQALNGDARRIGCSLGKGESMPMMGGRWFLRL
jgi:hypothetical protein